VPWIPPILALLGESFLGARAARRALGRPLTSDQRARLALWYTVGTSAIAAPIALWRLPRAAPSGLAWEG
jgi:hypothetical protein